MIEDNNTINNNLVSQNNNTSTDNSKDMSDEELEAGLQSYFDYWLDVADDCPRCYSIP